MPKARSKKQKALAMFKDNQIPLMCPLCRTPLTLKEESFICEHAHEYDLAKKGYVNLARAKGDDHYDRTLFEARSKLIVAGLFDPLIKHLIDVVMKHTPSTKTLVCDVGTGDGSVLSVLAQQLPQATCLGFDLSKDAIALATNHESMIGWYVADLANLPLQSNSVDVLLNVFSPANYREFTRVLHTDGVLIKVIPLSDHFHQIRKHHHQQDYTRHKTDAVVATLQRSMDIKETVVVRYDFSLVGNHKKWAFTMSPLSKHQAHSKGLVDQVTIDVQIIVAHCKSRI